MKSEELIELVKEWYNAEVTGALEYGNTPIDNTKARDEIIKRLKELNRLKRTTKTWKHQDVSHS